MSMAVAAPRYLPVEGYQIRHDPEAATKIAALLLDGYVRHPGEPVRLGRLLGTSDVWAIHCHVEALRRVGHLIDGTKGVAGYTYRGFAPPRRWVHVDHALRDVVREAIKAEAVEPLPGQMELL